MTASKKTTATKKSTPPKSTKQDVTVDDASFVHKTRTKVAVPFKKVNRRVQGLLARRPHRSFHKTRRRDYVRPLRLPGYWAFTEYVRSILWRNKKLFTLLVLVYGVMTIALVGVASQDMYTELGNTLRTTSGEVFKGNMGEVGKASLLLVSGVSGLMSQDLTTTQQIYVAILALFVWLTAVWLLRVVLAGRKPKLRDGLYNAGSPILPTGLVGIVLMLQLVPVGLVVIGYTAASSTGLLDGGVESMIFWTSATLLGSLSLYWITSTIIAMVVVTLPGMYPLQAIKTAGDLVIGRRVRILLRMLWLLLMLVIIWFIIMIPIILFDAWLKGIQPAIQWVPVVPIALLIMSTLSIVWSASYVYLLYRKVVDDDAAPA